MAIKFYRKEKLDINNFMFLNNKYTKWYFNIIYKSADIKVKGKTEHHHVLPSCLYPEYKDRREHPWNGVHLTTREHFLCHWLLIKMTEGKMRSKMIYALNGMKRQNKYQDRYETKITSRVYAKVKEGMRTQHSEFMKGRSSNKKGIPLTEEHKAKLSKAMKGRKRDKETIEKIAKMRIGCKYSEETKKRISDSLTGLVRGPMSEPEKKKRSKALKGRLKSASTTAKKAATLKKLAAEGKHHSQVVLTCPHCGKTAQKIVYARWHGDKCKLSKLVVDK